MIKSLINVVNKRYERDISIYDDMFLQKVLDDRLNELSMTSDIYLKYLSACINEAEVLFCTLNNTYSEFFRDPLTFSLLEKSILPDIFSEKARKGDKQIRIWVAGCAAGQEAYTFAILLDSLAKSWDFPVTRSIFATDISESELNIARKGVYNVTSLQNIQLRNIRNYFKKNNGSYTIIDNLKDWVDFSQYDLLDKHLLSPPNSIFGGFDLISCCNLMLYYQADIRNFFIKKMHDCLSLGGIIVTGDTERQFIKDTKSFDRIFTVSSFFRKTVRDEKKIIRKNREEK